MRSITGCILVAVLAAVPALAIDNPHVAGDFQGWDPGADAMIETAPGSGIYVATFTGMDSGSRQEFKITDGTWDNTIPNSNSWLFADLAGEITITYDSNTYDDGWSPTFDRIALSTDPGTWTAVGSFGTWDNADPAQAMTDMGDGLYMYEATGLVAACYVWKPVVTGSWDSISWDGRSINTANMEFCVSSPEDIAALWVDSFSGTVMVDVQYDCFGDLDGDKTVGLGDLGILLANYGATEGMHYIDGDMDEDGDIDLTDLGILLDVYGDSCL